MDWSDLPGCMLASYFGLVLLITTGFVVMVAIGSAKIGAVDALLQDVWEKQLSNETKTGIYQNWKCCGFEKPDNSPTCVAAVEKDPTIPGCRDQMVGFFYSLFSLSLHSFFCD
eukprot:TRINITY_DN583_c0_g1_i3.p2 TRINITY_DN583_c0_g1~~TRINITY_DN583_c0_g1_i3.p2  ORF type:complete len:113 (+),score=17.47 TRINITY_DN583_c0_g1_i3:227-565(+)